MAMLEAFIKVLAKVALLFAVSSELLLYESNDNHLPEKDRLPIQAENDTTSNDKVERDTAIVPAPEDKIADGIRCGVPLGLSTGYVSSAQITSSSAIPGHDTNGVRLLRSVSDVHAWCAQHNNDQQWVQVDLLEIEMITGVATQGRNKETQWVSTYKIRYSNTAQTWTTYQERGQDKVFHGNNDQNGVVKNTFAAPFLARYVRINPLHWFGHVCLRVEFYGCQNVCRSGLGMLSGALDSSRLAASSVHNEVHDESGSRLLTNTHGARAWCSLHLNTDQYLQIDVGLATTITAVATQGRDAVDQWVTSYLIRYSTDGSTWFTYNENGFDTTFSGNTDNRDVVSHNLTTPITARYVRFHPQAYHNHISFRAEVFGCPRACDYPLGMTTGEIDAHHITTSSSHDRDHDQRSARLLTDTPIGSWCTKHNNGYQWIQVDFGDLRRVTGVATQGRLIALQGITSYYIGYSNDGQGWTSYRKQSKQSPELFLANSDHDGVTKHTMHPSFVAKFARILPQSWFGKICLRFEFYGCRV